MLRKPLALAAAVTALALQAPSAHAAPALAGTFPSTGTLSGQPGRLTAGPDGNVWFTISGSPDKQLGKITPDGTVTEFELTGDPGLIGLTAGPDANLWATDIGNVIKIPPADPTTATAFTDNNILSTSEITVGPDGNLWAGSNGGVVKIPPGNPGGLHDTFFPGLFAGTALGLTAGGDGNIWVANNTFDPNTSTIVRVSTGGVVQGTPTPAGNTLQQSELAAGVGQVVFTEPIGGGVPERVGRVDFAGNVQFTDMPGGVGDPVGIVFGNDGAYWIANFGADAVRRMTPAGDVTSPITFAASSGPRQITKGPNDTLWVSLEQAKKIAKITGVSAPPPPTGGGGGGGTPDKTPPTISRLKLSAPKFRLGSQLATFSRKRTPVGTTINFSVSEQSTTTFTFARKAKGFKSGNRCVAHRPKGKRAKRCSRFVNAKPSLRFATSAGAHTLEFEGRLNRRHKLKPGRYRLSVRSTDAAGNKSKPRIASFTLLKK